MKVRVEIDEDVQDTEIVIRCRELDGGEGGIFHADRGCCGKRGHRMGDVTA